MQIDISTQFQLQIFYHSVSFVNLILRFGNIALKTKTFVTPVSLIFVLIFTTSNGHKCLADVQDYCIQNIFCFISYIYAYIYIYVK